MSSGREPQVSNSKDPKEANQFQWLAELTKRPSLSTALGALGGGIASDTLNCSSLTVVGAAGVGAWVGYRIDQWFRRRRRKRRRRSGNR